MEENQLDDPSLLLEFIADARELLQKMDPILLDLEKDPENTDFLNELLRSLHTIKGTSAFLGLKEINLLSHKVEDVLKAVQEKEIEPDKNVINTVFESIDALNRLVEVITQTEDKKIGELLGEEIEMKEVGEINVAQLVEEIESLTGKDKSLPTDPKFSPDILEQFMVEANEHFEIIEPLLIKLEKDPEDIDAVNNIFRSVHTIKGNSDYVGLSEIKNLSHKMEELLDRLRKQQISPNQEIIEIMFEGVDTLQIMISGLGQKDPKEVQTEELFKRLEQFLTHNANNEPENVKPEKNPANEDNLAIFFNSADQHVSAILAAAQDIKLEMERETALEVLLRSLSTLKSSAEYMGQDEICQTCKELLDTSMAIEKIGFDTILIESISQDALKLANKVSSLKNKNSLSLKDFTQEKKSPTKVSPSKKTKAPHAKKREIKEKKTVRVDQEKLDLFMNLVGELVVTRNAFNHLTQKLEIFHTQKEITEQMKNLSSQVNRISEELQNKVMEIRMVSVKNVFQRFPRMVRDLAVKMNKNVALVIRGEDTEIDKTVAEAIGDPLVHLIRNAVDHGIEGPKERIASGKNEEGTIILNAQHEGNNVIIEITDDGNGINEEIIKNKAIEKGLVTREAAELLSQNDIINFIFSPGFTTATSLTDVSGRGVGMDVVKSNIQKIKGTIDVSTNFGYGSKVKLNLPLTLAVFEALMVGLGNDTYAIPIDSVNETIRVRSEEIITLRGRESVNLRGDILGIVRLSKIFDNSSSIESQDIPIVVIQAIGKTIGIAVDELFNQEDILIKPLDKLLNRISGISGSTITGDGRVILVLDPIEILGVVANETVGVSL